VTCNIKCCTSTFLVIHSSELWHHWFGNRSCMWPVYGITSWAQQTPPLANATDLLYNWLVNASPLLPPSECNWLWAMASDNKLLDLRPADPFTRIYPKIESGCPMVTPHLPWKFHANRSSRFLIMLLTKKQRNKQRNRSITIPRQIIRHKNDI